MINVLPNSTAIEQGFTLETLGTFRWEGMAWTADVLLPRLIPLVIAISIVFLATLFFHRFDPSHFTLQRFDLWARLRRRVPPRRRKRRGGEAEKEALQEQDLAGGFKLDLATTLSPLAQHGRKPSFRRTITAELRLMLKGHRWWWYAGAAGLILATLLVPLEIMHQRLLPIAWVWPVLIWSSMGTRETRYATDQIVFSAAYPLQRQLPATWLAGVIIAMIMGSGGLIQMLLVSEWVGVITWTIAVLFIPALALGLGTLSGVSKLFEAIYIALWYFASVERIPSLDFMGRVPQETLASGGSLIFLVVTFAFLAVAFISRRRQLQN